VSNEIVHSNGYSLEGMFSEFRGEAGRCDRMEASEQDHMYFSKNCKHGNMMEFCVTLLDVMKYVFESVFGIE